MSAMECNPLITLLGESNGLEGHSFGISAGIRIQGFEFLLQKTGCFVEDRLHQQHLSTQSTVWQKKYRMNREFLRGGASFGVGI